jgi:hypothetical protein
MTNNRFAAKASGTNAAAVARRLLLCTMTAALLALAGCGDSGEDSEDDASCVGCRTLAANPAAPCLTRRTGWAQGSFATERDVTRVQRQGCRQMSEKSLIGCLARGVVLPAPWIYKPMLAEAPLLHRSSMSDILSASY